MVLVEVVVARAEHGHPLTTEEGHDVVLGGTVVAGRHDLGAAGSQSLQQHSGLGLEVQAHADAVAGEGQPLGELGAGSREQRHPGSDPFDAGGAAGTEIGGGGTVVGHASTLHI